MRTPVLASATLLAVAACAGPHEPGDSPLLTALPRQLSPAETGVTSAANAFAFDLLRQAIGELPAGSNAVLSPLSVSMALAMTMNGAAGATWEEMRSALRLGGLAEPDINGGYRDVIALLRELDSRVEMRVANSMWARPGLALSPAFSAAGSDFFDAEIRTLDFASPDALPTINGWVKDRTGGRIPRLLENIAREEVLFLINAIYFKGRWRSGFDVRETRTGTFHAGDGVGRSAALMRQEAPLRYAESERWQAVDLLYGNGAFSMTVVLPRPGETPASLLDGMDAAGWSALVATLAEQEVQLTLPRFRLDYARSLGADLQALGMAAAFDPGRADLSRINGGNGDRLYLTRVEHKVYVEVNEEGTEAVAATAVGVGVVSAPQTYVMTVDRPFLVAIRERFSGTILFLGIINSIES